MNRNHGRADAHRTLSMRRRSRRRPMTSPSRLRDRVAGWKPRRSPSARLANPTRRDGGSVLGDALRAQPSWLTDFDPHGDLCDALVEQGVVR